MKSAELDGREKRYKSLFDFSPVPMWENDFSDVEQSLYGLRRQGITDLSEYLAKHPQVVLELSQLVHMLHINNAVVTLFKADNKEKLVLSIPELFLHCWTQPFITQLQAIWDHKDKSALTLSVTTCKGIRWLYKWNGWRPVMTAS